MTRFKAVQLSELRDITKLTDFSTQVFSLLRQVCLRRSRTQQEALQVRKHLYMQVGQRKGN